MEKASGCIWRQVPPRAHNHAQLVGNRVHHRSASARIHIDHHAGVCIVCVQKSDERNSDPVIHALAQHLALALAHANDCVGRAIHADLFAQRVARAKHVVDNVGADNGDTGTCWSSISVKKRPSAILRFEIGGIVQVQPRMLVSVVDCVP